MGGHVSTPDRSGMARSDAIDRQIEEDSMRFKRECKILLLGSCESGKSTILKQMKILYQGGFSLSELAEYRSTVYKNVLDSIHAVIVYMREIGWEFEDYDNRSLARKILEYKLDTRPAIPLSSLPHLGSSTNPQIVFSSEIAEAIHQVGKDPIIPKVMDKLSSNFYLMDSAVYFFGEVLRIGSPGYVPNEKDMLCARQKAYEINEMRFTAGQLSIHMFDIGGQNSERKKWMHFLEGITSIMFCTALSEYDQVLMEEKTQNRMRESLMLFESVVNSRWFLRTSIILFLNKVDVFKNKLPKVPLEQHFPEYTGGTDINEAARFILWKFMQLNRARLSVYPHLMQATDTTSIRLVFAVVKETLLQNALKDSGIL